MIISQKIKYNKLKKGYVKKNLYDKKFNILLNGIYGIKFLESGRVSYKELNSVVNSLRKVIKKVGIIYINIVCDYPITSKPVEVRMGKGKGKVDYWVSLVKKGKIGVEVLLKGDKLKNFELYSILKKVSKKISLKTKIVRGRV